MSLEVPISQGYNKTSQTEESQVETQQVLDNHHYYNWVTRQNGWEIQRLPRTPHATCAHKRVRTIVETITVANFAPFFKVS